jgi:hypothetical protein
MPDRRRDDTAAIRYITYGVQRTTSRSFNVVGGGIFELKGPTCHNGDAGAVPGTSLIALIACTYMQTCSVVDPE